MLSKTNSQENLNLYLRYFLDCVAKWTPRWFNKPKFHIILHLTTHIHQFGPPLLFATETFESFNVVIRGFSIHSNRQAPYRPTPPSNSRPSRTAARMRGQRRRGAGERTADKYA